MDGSDSSGSGSDDWEGGGMPASPSHSTARSDGQDSSLGSPWGSPLGSPSGSPGQGSPVLGGAGYRHSDPHKTPKLRAQGGGSNTPSDAVTSDVVDLPKCPDWFEDIWTAMNDGFIDLHDDMFKEGTYTYHEDMTAWLNDNKGTIERWWDSNTKKRNEILILLTNLLVLYHEQGVLDKTVPASKDAEAQKAYLAEKKGELTELQADILAEMNSAGKGRASKASGGNKYVALRF